MAPLLTTGIDIHPYYQRSVNWSEVAKSTNPKVNYGWVKVSDGGAAYRGRYNGKIWTPDSHVRGFKSINLPVGGYHYAQFSPTPEKQADIFCMELHRLGLYGVVGFLDLEAPFSANTYAKDFSLRFLRRMIFRGFRPGVYMSASFAKALRPDLWDIPDLLIVIARYGKVPEGSGSARYTGRYDVHQYSSVGRVRGFSANVDLDDTRNNRLYGALIKTPKKEVKDPVLLGSSVELKPVGRGSVTLISPMRGLRLVIGVGYAGNADNPEALHINHIKQFDGNGKLVKLLLPNKVTKVDPADPWWDQNGAMVIEDNTLSVEIDYTYSNTQHTATAGFRLDYVNVYK